MCDVWTHVELEKWNAETIPLKGQMTKFSAIDAHNSKL